MAFTIYGLDKMKEQLEKRINEKAQQASEKAYTQAKKEAEQKAREIANNAIDRWYGEYSPKFYNRFGLKNFEILSQEDEILVDFSQQISVHQDNDMVLSWVVEEGYHGGSPSSSFGYMWRTPYPYFMYWGRPASKSRPIIDEINEEIQNVGPYFKERSRQLFRQYLYF